MLRKRLLLLLLVVLSSSPNLIIIVLVLAAVFLVILEPLRLAATPPVISVNVTTTRQCVTVKPENALTVRTTPRGSTVSGARQGIMVMHPSKTVQVSGCMKDKGDCRHLINTDLFSARSAQAVSLFSSECGCDGTGSFPEPCNNVTGQCDCKDNVDGRTCYKCQVSEERGCQNGCNASVSRK